MNDYTILVTGRENISLNPANVYEEVVQNIRTIISTPKYSVPLNRDFGLDETILDSPMNTARAKIISDLILAVRQYEPRANITHAEFIPDHDGKLSLRIRISLQGEILS